MCRLLFSSLTSHILIPWGVFNLSVCESSLSFWNIRVHSYALLFRNIPKHLSLFIIFSFSFCLLNVFQPCLCNNCKVNVIPCNWTSEKWNNGGNGKQSWWSTQTRLVVVLGGEDWRNQDVFDNVPQYVGKMISNRLAKRSAIRGWGKGK